MTDSVRARADAAFARAEAPPALPAHEIEAQRQRENMQRLKALREAAEKAKEIRTRPARKPTGSPRGARMTIV